MFLSRKKFFLIALGAVLVLGWFFLKDKTYNLPSISDVFEVSPVLEVQQQLDASVYRLPVSPKQHGLNLIFFSDGYLSWEEFEKDMEIILREMKTVEPWKSYGDYNIYKIFPKELDICGVKIEDERKPALRCSPEKINSYLNKLVLTNSFKLVTLSRREFQGWANGESVPGYFAGGRTGSDGGNEGGCGGGGAASKYGEGANGGNGGDGSNAGATGFAAATRAYGAGGGGGGGTRVTSPAFAGGNGGAGGGGYARITAYKLN